MDARDWAQLRSRYTSWRIRPGAGGRTLIATRLDRSYLTAHELDAGLAMTLIEDDANLLISALVQQTRLESHL